MKVERVRQEMSLMLWSYLVNTADFCECKVVQLGNNFENNIRHLSEKVLLPCFLFCQVMHKHYLDEIGK